MSMGHWSNAICHIDPDLYDIWHLTSGPLTFESGFKRAIENNLNRCAWFENKVFAAGEKHGGSACSSSSGAANHRAFAAVGNDADQCSLRGGCADGLRIVTLAGVALHGRFSLLFTGAAHAAKR